jgi:iron-sulfur cluster assembly protein
MITITPAAAEQIRDSARQGNLHGMPLRIAAKRADDGSIQYGMGFADEALEGDQKFNSEGIDIVVSNMSMDLLKDTVLDFVELDNGEKNFIFKNPHDPNYQPPQ